MWRFRGPCYPGSMARAAKDWLMIALAWLLILGGAVMCVVPGPGLPVLFAGLYLLSRKSSWARKRLERGMRRLRERWPKAYKSLMRAREEARERRRQVRELLRGLRAKRPAESAE